MLWRMLLSNWLRRTAKERIYAEVMRAAGQGTGGAADRDAASSTTHAATEEGVGADDEAERRRQRPCDVGVVFALGIESGGFEDLLEGRISIRGENFAVQQGGLRGRHVVVVRSGIGRRAAREATERLIAGHRPAWIISAGFAGALQPQLRPGDIVMANSVVDQHGERLAIDVTISDDERSRHPNLHVGRLVTADRIVHRAADKRALGERYEALAVDMETLAVAEVCLRRAVRFLAIRVISDAMGEELPDDLNRLVDSRTAARRAGAVVGALFKRPSSAKDMWNLRERALVASDRLATFLKGVVPQLPPPEKQPPPSQDG